jgi:hypothetical protein
MLENGVQLTGSEKNMRIVPDLINCLAQKELRRKGGLDKKIPL